MKAVQDREIKLLWRLEYLCTTLKDRIAGKVITDGTSIGPRLYLTNREKTVSCQLTTTYMPQDSPEIKQRFEESMEVALKVVKYGTSVLQTAK